MAHPPSKQLGVIIAVQASRARVEAAHSSERMRQKKSSSQREPGPHAFWMFAQNALHSAEPTTVGQPAPTHGPPVPVVPPSDGPPPLSSPPHAAARSANISRNLFIPGHHEKTVQLDWQGKKARGVWSTSSPRALSIRFVAPAKVRKLEPFARPACFADRAPYLVRVRQPNPSRRA